MQRRLLLLFLPVVAACSVLPERPYVETQRFPLAPRRTAPPASRRGRKVLLIRLMRAAPGQESRGLRSLRADGTEGVDFYAEWIAPPAELAEEALRRWFSESGLFSAVVAPGTRARADLVLETELTALHADLGRHEAVAGISAVLLQDGGLAPKLLTQLSVTGTAPLPPGENLPAETLALAMNAALADALSKLEQGIAPFA